MRMDRKTLLVEGEYYHIYNRGVNKQRIFNADEDYRRFMAQLYLENDEESVRLCHVLASQKYKDQPVNESLSEIFSDPDLRRRNRVVDVLAYCLMPNHFHIVLRPRVESGVSIFMQRVLTGYSMYFNIKHERSGALFGSRYKSKHINSDPYFRWIFSYVHLNPVKLIEARWKEEGIKNVKKVAEFMRNYEYSSSWDYLIDTRPERAVLSMGDAPPFSGEESDFEQLLRWYKAGEELGGISAK